MAVPAFSLVYKFVVAVRLELNRLLNGYETDLGRTKIFISLELRTLTNYF